jgi:hypothetical protein
MGLGRLASARNETVIIVCLDMGPRSGFYGPIHEQKGRTLSIRDIPDFPAMDMFSGKATAPYPGFGGVVQDSGELERQLHVDAARVREEVRRVFRAELASSTSIPKDLDDIIERMWKTGWDPRAGDLNLFTHDFGLLLIEATLDLLGGRPIFRSLGDDVYIHNSIFWPGVEAFPFHKAFKCLTETDGESMAYFVRGVGHELDEKGLLTPKMKMRLPRAS